MVRGRHELPKVAASERWSRFGALACCCTGCAASVTPTQADAGSFDAAFADAASPDTAVEDGIDMHDGMSGIDSGAPDGGTLPRRRSRVRMAQVAPEYADRGGVGHGGSTTGLFFANEPEDDRHAYRTFTAGPCRAERYNAYTSIPAGILSLRVGSLPAAPVPFLGRGQPSYFQAFDSPRWRDGDRMTADATGDVAPAFSATVTFPVLVRVDSPELPAAGAALPIRLSDGIRLGWSVDRPPPLVEVLITAWFGSATSPNRAKLTCFFPGADRSASIPAPALTYFAGANGGSIQVGAADLQLVRIGGFDVEVSAVNSVFATGITVE